MQAMKRLMLSLLFSSAVACVGIMGFHQVPGIAPSALAAEPSEIITQPVCTNAEQAGQKIAGCDDKVDLQIQKGDNRSFLTTLVNAFVYVGGLIAVIFVIIGGVRYITSSGDAKQIQAAKETLLYAAIGLIVIALARVIIGFVIGAVG